MIPLVGVSKTEQLQENLGAISVAVTDEEMQTLDAAGD
ncbi:MAG: aldo/keto reductase [Cyclobacteriaceae bacterium]|nr:aldo/keto reductase [Cyclobacteriaceae bacterium HetDA_MAG_MS6]